MSRKQNLFSSSSNNVDDHESLDADQEQAFAAHIFTYHASLSSIVGSIYLKV